MGGSLKAILTEKDHHAEGCKSSRKQPNRSGQAAPLVRAERVVVDDVAVRGHKRFGEGNDRFVVEQAPVGRTVLEHPVRDVVAVAGAVLAGRVFEIGRAHV